MKWFSLTGLIVGSIVPDMEFLLRLRETNMFGHSWLGVVAFDIPAAILLSFVFHLLVRDQLIMYSPNFFRERLSFLLLFNWPRYFKQHKVNFFISVLIGIASHFFLDAFTHYDGAIAKRSSFFFNEIVIAKHALPIYLLLQVATSLIGGLYILWFIYKMKRSEAPLLVKNTFAYWLSLTLISIAIFVGRIMIDTTHQSFDDILIAAGGSCIYALLVVSIIFLKAKKILPTVLWGGSYK